MGTPADGAAPHVRAHERLATRSWWARSGVAWLWTLPAALTFVSLLTSEMGILEAEELVVRPDEYPLVDTLHSAAAHLTLVGLTAITMVYCRLWIATQRIRDLYRARLQPSADLLEIASGLLPSNRLYVLADTRFYAVCVGLWRPAIYVSSSLIEALTPMQVRAVLAHEESHRLRRDPLRLFICRAVGRRLDTIPWSAHLVAQVELRAEIRADRFARAATKRAYLASALLRILCAEGEPGGPLAERERSESPRAPALLPAVTLPLGGREDAAIVDKRIRYLLLPEDMPLPRLLPRDCMGSVTLLTQVADRAGTFAATPARVVGLHNSLSLLPALIDVLCVLLQL
jgi:Zn-dependent protease with chaperone function